MRLTSSLAAPVHLLGFLINISITTGMIVMKLNKNPIVFLQYEIE